MMGSGGMKSGCLYWWFSERASSRVSSRCWSWSSPTGTWVALPRSGPRRWGREVSRSERARSLPVRRRLYVPVEKNVAGHEDGVDKQAGQDRGRRQRGHALHVHRAVQLGAFRLHAMPDVDTLGESGWDGGDALGMLPLAPSTASSGAASPRACGTSGSRQAQRARAPAHVRCNLGRSVWHERAGRQPSPAG